MHFCRVLQNKSRGKYGDDHFTSGPSGVCVDSGVKLSVSCFHAPQDVRMWSSYRQGQNIYVHCGVCVCVCVRERERERGGGGGVAGSIRFKLLMK